MGGVDSLILMSVCNCMSRPSRFSGVCFFAKYGCLYAVEQFDSFYIQFIYYQ